MQDSPTHVGRRPAQRKSKENADEHVVSTVLCDGVRKKYSRNSSGKWARDIVSHLDLGGLSGWALFPHLCRQTWLYDAGIHPTFDIPKAAQVELQVYQTPLLKLPSEPLQTFLEGN